MALKSYSLKGLCFVWEILVPDSDLNLKSSVFTFDGSEWRFELKIAWNTLCQEDMWTIKIYNANKTKDFHKFQVRVQVENKTGEFHFLRITGVEYPTNAEIPLVEQTKSSLLRCFSNVKWEGSMKFIFTIYNNIFCTDDLNRKGKPLSDIPDVSPGVNSHLDVMTISGFTDVRTVSDSKKEDKFVQTSSSMDVLPCLESLSADLQKIMDSDFHHDAELRCGDCIFPVHGFIIAARSEVFKSMLQRDLLEGNASSLHVSDIEVPVLKHFLRYLYTGILPELTTDIAIKLYETGEKYAVESLKRRCSSFLKECLDRGNVFRILIVADVHNDAGLKEGTIAFILEREIHQEEEEWIIFCNDQPKLANEILNRALKMLKSSKQKP